MKDFKLKDVMIKKVKLESFNSGLYQDMGFMFYRAYSNNKLITNYISFSRIDLESIDSMNVLFKLDTFFSKEVILNILECGTYLFEGERIWVQHIEKIPSIFSFESKEYSIKREGGIF